MAEATTAVEPTWLSERRRSGASLAQELPLPTKKLKGWEFTDLSGLEIDSYIRQSSVDGHHSAGDLPEGVVVTSLLDALTSHPALIEERLGSIVPIRDPFVARNDSEWTDGVLVYVPRGIRLEVPVKVELNVDGEGESVNWRTLIVLEEGAEAEVWEHHGSSGDDNDSLLNSVVELSVGPAATLNYVSTQDISEKSWIFSTQRAEVERDASLEWTALGFGSGRGKVRMETKLAGQGSSAKVTGGYAGGGTQHLDYDTIQEHSAPNTFSDLAFRGVLGDHSTAVWRGMIQVDEGAQQTDAFQESRNLILSPDAHADAIPGLEIKADDVKCTHAAAIAQIDPEQLFYLTSRGLDEDQSRQLVIGAFLQELVERIPEGEVREDVSASLERRLEEILD